MIRRSRHDSHTDTAGDARFGAASPDPVPAPFPRSPGADIPCTPVWALGLTDGSHLPARSPYAWRLVADTVLGYGLEGVHAALHARVFEPDPAAGPGAPGAEPVVLLAQFGDHVGPSITNSIEEAAAAAQARFYPDGELMRVALLYPRGPWYSQDVPAVPLTLQEVRFAARSRRSRLRRWSDRRRARRHAEHGGWQPTVTVVSPDGVTRHSLPTPPPTPGEWTFHGPCFGRDLTVEIPADQRSAVVGDEPGAPRAGLRFIHPTSVRVPALLGETSLDAWPVELYTAEIVAGPEGGGAEAVARRAAVQRRTAAEIGFIDALTDPPPDSYHQFGAVQSRTTSPGGPAHCPHTDADDGEQPGASR